ncbi:putative membrane protein [Arthrobacter oryzae]|nr:putative membrane protein [Arthrobacter oryzae]
MSRIPLRLHSPTRKSYDLFTETVPSSLYAQGTDPDARFSLANERTFLAWIRTSLALIAAGVALETLGLDLHPGLRLAASITLIIAGIAAPIQAWFGWLQIERALRLDMPLPSAALAFPIVIAVSAAGVLIFLSVILA